MKIIPYNIEGAKGRYLYKFLSEKHLLKFLQTGEMWFSRADEFGDKMECVMISDLNSPAVPNFDKIEKRKRKYLISCFHIGDYETLAFWDTYSKTDDNRRKYALRFNSEHLINILHDKCSTSAVPEACSEFIYGNVKYKNLIAARGDKLNNLKVKYPSFRKESAFSYEKEYRFVLKLSKEFKAEGVGISLGHTTDLKFNILVNPLLELSDYISALKKIRSSGFQKKWKLTPITKWVKPEVWKAISNKTRTSAKDVDNVLSLI